jgi:ribosome-binding protein aMBF1 (putative translation factor)
MPRKNLDELREEHPVSDRAAYEQSYAEATLAHELARMVYSLRTHAGITQTELARRMGTTQSSVARWESGGSLPTIDLLDRLGQAVEVRLRLVAEHSGVERTEQPSAVAFGAR